MADTRLLIDFATGENWELPLYLYERYDKDCVELQLKVPNDLTCIQYWLSLLTREERNSISIKKPT